MKTLLSVHDVMPETLARVEAILATLSKADVPAEKTTLLVVPGRRWSASQLQTLSHFQRQGYRLAGHGWQHRTDTIAGLKHRLHAALISRRAAEHLSLNSDQIRTLILNNHRWFGDNDLGTPDLYVPPAWAMGAIASADLASLPFRYYEYSSGVLDARSGRFRRLALTGYEADRRWRTPLLWSWNRLNTALLSRFSPLRLSIHPFDFDYYLSRSMIRDIQRSQQFLSCEEVFAA